MDEILVKVFERVKDNHRRAIRYRAARVVLGPSVIRVFKSGTKDHLLPILVDIPIDELAALRDEARFQVWFEGQLDILAGPWSRGWG